MKDMRNKRRYKSVQVTMHIIIALLVFFIIWSVCVINLSGRKPALIEIAELDILILDDSFSQQGMVKLLC